LRQGLKKINGQYDILLVGYSDNRWLPIWAKLINKKPVVWDAFYSKYDVLVFDRKLVKNKGLKSFYHWLVEWLACWAADIILLDTNCYIDYFIKTFKVDKGKFIRVLIGADEAIFYPLSGKASKEEFLVHFHGKFIPVQGIQYIIQAAKTLEKYEDVKFQLIGGGQTYDQMLKLAKELSSKNIFFLGYQPFEKLNSYLQEADISLGNFGDTDKATRVIATKSYETIAAGRPLISADAPAMREIFENRKNVLFCQRANPKDLANKILELKNNRELRNEIAQGGYQLYKQIAEPKIIGKKFLEDISALQIKN
jgi:glycosyltransferase involved in cell wall biosynthesis